MSSGHRFLRGEEAARNAANECSPIHLGGSVVDNGVRQCYTIHLRRRRLEKLRVLASDCRGASALEHDALRLLMAALKVPTFDGHLNQSNTDWRRWFDAIHTAPEIDPGIQA